MVPSSISRGLCKSRFKDCLGGLGLGLIDNNSDKNDNETPKLKQGLNEQRLTTKLLAENRRLRFP